MNSNGRPTELFDALKRYDPSGCYDETFDQVHERIERTGEATKLDISALLFWKRLPRARWWRDLLERPDRSVRDVTRRAFAANLSLTQRLDHLADLPGFASRGAVASTLLAAWNPSELAVVDRWARLGLRALLRESWVADRPYPAYLGQVIRLRDTLPGVRPECSARDVDKALYVLGREAGTSRLPPEP